MQKGADIALRTLMGLLYTAVLILFAYLIVSRFVYTDDSEKDIVKLWAEDIRNLGNDKTTQLLPLEKSTFDQDKYAIAFLKPNFKQDVTFTLQIDQSDPMYYAPQDQFQAHFSSSQAEISIKSKCEGVCLCLIDISRSRANYCEDLVVSDLVFFGGFDSIAPPSSLNLFPSAGDLFLVSSKYDAATPSTSYAFIDSNILYVHKNRDKITVCGTDTC